MAIDSAMTILESLEKGMKTYEFGIEMGRKKINNSFALLAAQALAAYWRGKSDDAQMDFETCK